MVNKELEQYIVFLFESAVFVISNMAKPEGFLRGKRFVFPLNSTDYTVRTQIAIFSNQMYGLIREKPIEGLGM